MNQFVLLFGERFMLARDNPLFNRLAHKDSDGFVCFAPRAFVTATEQDPLTCKQIQDGFVRLIRFQRDGCIDMARQLSSLT
ncbi:hypothetical protein [Burkholderia cenocepacia]|uniref:hypothetical protein n=1 Tax=Burkholderia cenocepacia TaxID=95486 RepID=UPI0008479922|nr:hypothetical protein [Burkholderia cenocepacia]